MVILMMMFTCLAVGSEEYKYDLTNNSVKENYTVNVSWPELESNKTGLIEQFAYKTTNYVGWLAMSGSKYFVEYGYSHPEYDFKFGMDLAIFSMYAIIFSVLFFPIIIMCSLIYLGITHLRSKLKEKKEEKKNGN